VAAASAASQIPEARRFSYGKGATRNPDASTTAFVPAVKTAGYSKSDMRLKLWGCDRNPLAVLRMRRYRPLRICVKRPFLYPDPPTAKRAAATAQLFMLSPSASVATPLRPPRETVYAGIPTGKFRRRILLNLSSK
jgi:hypothetical protein